MDLCYVCQKNERNKDYRGLCSYDCLIKYACVPSGDCLVQRLTIWYKDKKYFKRQARSYVWEELKGETVPDNRKIYSICGTTGCLNIDHMKLVSKTEYATLLWERSAPRRHRKAEEKQRRIDLRISSCSFCRKEISMLDRVAYYCDKNCSARDSIKKEIDNMAWVIRADSLSVESLYEAAIEISLKLTRLAEANKKEKEC